MKSHENNVTCAIKIMQMEDHPIQYTLSCEGKPEKHLRLEHGSNTYPLILVKHSYSPTELPSQLGSWSFVVS